MKQQTVFVGLSGGVDSSVAALRLKKAGYNVVGIFIRVWQPDFLQCNWEAERLDAMRVAAHLDIPFLTCDARERYKQEVGEYFISEYQAGRTPNPDVLCNKEVKFGAFLDFAIEKGADFVATGHYARRVENNGQFALHRGVDTDKDQTYFLWTLTQKQLKHILLPVGDSTKATIRKEAEAAGLPTAVKKDSQGVCFLGHIDVADFLSHFIELQPGTVLDEGGTAIGSHKGALIYTLGQRHGFTIATAGEKTEPHYVVAKNLDDNTITVVTKPQTLPASTALELQETNWITTVPTADYSCEAQFRYRQKPISVQIHANTDNTATLSTISATDVIAAGQSCVLYDGDTCLGGGILK